RIVAVQTGCCPHTAIRDDITANLDAVESLEAAFPGLDLVLVESGGDNLTATVSTGLVDRQIFVLDVARRGKGPRQGRAGRAPGRSAGDQQDRPGAAGGCRPRRDGAGRAGSARRAPGAADLAPRRARRGARGRLGASPAHHARGEPCGRRVPATAVRARAAVVAEAGPDGGTRLAGRRPRA